MQFDVFNGDADGVISLLQLRLAEPKPSQLITGVKRDIELLQRVPAQAGDQVTVLDISLEKNLPALTALLNRGVAVRYFDHHRPGAIPDHPQLAATIDMDANQCTALLVDKALAGRYRLWAITAAYGDNLVSVADSLSWQYGLSSSQAGQLKELGTLLNYNGYGASLADLHISPADLFRSLLPYADPFDVIADSNSPFPLLQRAYQQDLDNACNAVPTYVSDAVALYQLGAEPWARRISGTFGNLLANQAPQRAHGVVTENADGSLLVSVRAPLNNRTGADEVCSQFATGGGRKAAAGINQLAPQQLPALIQALTNQYS